MLQVSQKEINQYAKLRLFRCDVIYPSIIISTFMYISKHTRLLRHVIVDKADLKLLVALLCQNPPDLSPLAVDFTEAPNLLCGPCVRDAFHIHLDYHAVDTVLGPARFEELICVKIRKLDDSRRPLSVMYHKRGPLSEISPPLRSNNEV